MDWDLNSYFREFGNPTYLAFKEELQESIDELSQRAGKLIEDPGPSPLKAWERLLMDVELMEARFSHISSYIGCLTAADAANEDYLKEENAFAETEARFSKLNVVVLDDEGRTLSETPYMIPINAAFDAALRKLPDWEAQLVTILRTRTLEKINHGKTPIREDHLKQDLRLIGREF